MTTRSGNGSEAQPGYDRSASGSGEARAARTTLTAIGLVLLVLLLSAAGDWSGGIGLVLFLIAAGVVFLHLPFGVFSIAAVWRAGLRPGNAWIPIYYVGVLILTLLYIAWVQEWAKHAPYILTRLTDRQTSAYFQSLERQPPNAAAALAALERGANLDGVGYTGRPAIILAARTGDLRLLEATLAAGAEPNAGKAGGTTALYEAARGVPNRKDYDPSETLSLVEALLSAGADPNAATGTGRTALLAACEAGAVDIATRLVEAGANAAAHDRNGQGCATVALRAGQGATLNWAMQQELAPSDLGEALRIAFDRPDVQAFRALLAHGATANRIASARHGLLSFLEYARPQDEALFDALVEFRQGPSILAAKHHAWLLGLSTTGRLVTTRALGLGIDPDSRGLNQDSVLHALVRSDGSLHTAPGAEPLLEAGADVDALNTAGMTPLLMAARLGHAEDLGWLLARGANPMLADKANRTVWHYVADGTHAAAAQALADASAPLPAAEAQSGLLLQAIDDSATVLALLAAGFSPEPTEPALPYPVHAAAGSDAVESLQALLRAGASPDAIDPQGHTLTTLAAANGADRVLSWLVTQGHRLDQADSKRRTPLETAVTQEQLAAIAVILNAGIAPTMSQRYRIRKLLSDQPRSDAEAAQQRAIRAVLGEEKQPDSSLRQ